MYLKKKEGRQQNLQQQVWRTGLEGERDGQLKEQWVDYRDTLKIKTEVREIIVLLCLKRPNNLLVTVDMSHNFCIKRKEKKLKLL